MSSHFYMYIWTSYLFLQNEVLIALYVDIYLFFFRNKFIAPAFPQALNILQRQAFQWLLERFHAEKF